MPDYEVELGGRKMRITAENPEAASVAAEEYIKANPPKQPAEPVSRIGDVARGAGAGVAEGVAGTIGSPRAMTDLVDTGVDLVSQGASKAGSYLGGLAGRPPPPETMGPPMPPAPPPKRIDASRFGVGLGDLPSAKDVKGWLGTLGDVMSNTSQAVGGPGLSEQGRSVVTGDYKPQTTAGAIAKTGAELGTGAMLTSPLAPAATGLSAGREALRQGRIWGAIGAGSEGLKQGADALLGEDSTTGNVLKVVAQLGMGTVAALRDTYKGPYGTALQKSIGNITDAEFRAAQDLQARYARQGMQITASEALDHVTGGRSGMAAVARYVANTPTEGGTVLRDAYARRAGASEQRMNDLIGGVYQGAEGEQGAYRRAADAAAQYVDDPRARSVKLANRYYRDSRSDPIDTSSLEQLLRETPTGEFIGSAATRKAVNDILGNQWEARLLGNPDQVNWDTVGFWHETLKKLRNQVEYGKNPMGEGINDPAQIKRAASVIDRALKDNTVFSRAQAITERGFEMSAERRNASVGQIGELANGKGSKDDIAKAIKAEIRPGDAAARDNGREAAELVGAVGRRDPMAARKVAGDLLQNAWEASALRNPSDQFRAARAGFEMASNTEERARLREMIRAVPGAGPQAAQGFENLMEWFRIQGNRAPTNSSTAFNIHLEREFKGMPMTNPAKAGRQAITGFSEMFERWNYNKRSGEIGHILTDPNGVEQLRRLARITPKSQTFGYAALQLLNANQPDEEKE